MVRYRSPTGKEIEGTPFCSTVAILGASPHWPVTPIRLKPAERNRGIMGAHTPDYGLSEHGRERIADSRN